MSEVCFSKRSFFKKKNVVIVAMVNDQLILVRHKTRITWELPGDYIEEHKNSEQTARRKLFEETGAVEFDLQHVCVYWVKNNPVTSYGDLYFAEVKKIKQLPESKIDEIRFAKEVPETLTYPKIHKKLYLRVMAFINKKKRQGIRFTTSIIPSTHQPL